MDCPILQDQLHPEKLIAHPKMRSVILSDLRTIGKVRTSRQYSLILHVADFEVTLGNRCAKLRARAGGSSAARKMDGCGWPCDR